MPSVERDIIIMTRCLCFIWNDGVVVVVMSLWFGPPHRVKVAFVLTDKLDVFEFHCGHKMGTKTCTHDIFHP